MTCGRPTPDVTVPVTTCLTFQGRSEVLIHAADAVIIVGGGAGTLAEIAIAYLHRKPMVALRGVGGWGDRLPAALVDGCYLDDRRLRLVAPLTATTQQTQVIDQGHIALRPGRNLSPVGETGEQRLGPLGGEACLHPPLAQRSGEEGGHHLPGDGVQRPELSSGSLNQPGSGHRLDVGVEPLSGVHVSEGGSAGVNRSRPSVRTRRAANSAPVTARPGLNRPHWSPRTTFRAAIASRSARAQHAHVGQRAVVPAEKGISCCAACAGGPVRQGLPAAHTCPPGQPIGRPLRILRRSRRAAAPAPVGCGATLLPGQ